MGLHATMVGPGGRARCSAVGAGVGVAVVFAALAAGCVSGSVLVSDDTDHAAGDHGVDTTPDGAVEAPDEGSVDDSGLADDEGAADDSERFDVDADFPAEEGDVWDALPEFCERVFQSDVSCRYSGVCPDGFRYCCWSYLCGDPPFPSAVGCCHDLGCGTGSLEHFHCEEALGDQIPMPDGCGAEPWETHCPPDRPYCCGGSVIRGGACSDHEMENWYSCVLAAGSADGGG